MAEATGRVHIALLGGLTVTVGPVVVTDEAWPTRRSAELVALLALADGHRLVRDQVIEALWPHLSPAAGAANLRKAAHFARQVLGSEQAVRLAGGRVALFPGRVVDTDIAGYERRARAVLRSGDRAAATALAAEYPGGPPARPAVRRVDPGTAGPAARAATSRCCGSAGEWERLVAAEPADEQAHRELMRAALRGGRPAHRDPLVRAAAHEPGRASSACRPRRRAGRCTRSASPVCRRRPAVVGRQPELARMAAALRSAAPDRPAALVLRGAPGIGKSTLCRELAALARDAGWRVATVTAGPARGAYAALSAARRTSCSAATGRCSTGSPDRPARCWPS